MNEPSGLYSLMIQEVNISVSGIVLEPLGKIAPYQLFPYQEKILEEVEELCLRDEVLYKQ